MKIGVNHNFSTDRKIKYEKGEKNNNNLIEGLSSEDMVVSNPFSKNNSEKYGMYILNSVAVNYYPQDPSVGGPVTMTVSGDDITSGPDNSRIDTKGNVKPGTEGMVFDPSDPSFINVQTLFLKEPL